MRGRRKRCFAVAITHSHFLKDFNRIDGAILRRDTRGKKAAHKFNRRAIQNGHFLGINIDTRIVDTTASKCRHQMFNGRDGNPISVGNLCAKAAFWNRIIARGDQRIRIAHIHPIEPNAAIGHAWMDGQGNRLSPMKAYTFETCRFFQRCLHSKPFCRHVPTIVGAPNTATPSDCKSVIQTERGRDNSSFVTLCNNAKTHRQNLARNHRTLI